MLQGIRKNPIIFSLAIDYCSDAIALQVKNTRYVLTSPDLEYMQMIVDEVVERHKLKRA